MTWIFLPDEINQVQSLADSTTQTNICFLWLFHMFPWDGWYLMWKRKKGNSAWDQVTLIYLPYMSTRTPLFYVFWLFRVNVNATLNQWKRSFSENPSKVKTFAFICWQGKTDFGALDVILCFQKQQKKILVYSEKERRVEVAAVLCCSWLVGAGRSSCVQRH